MQCAYCAGALNVFSFQLKESTNTPQRVACSKCGSSHVLHKGSLEAINPRPLASDSDGLRVMPWRDASTRPIDAGLYECRFAEIEPEIIRLMWNGSYFMHNGARVAMRGFIAWRGKWA
jgi:hypothetical protein